MKRATAQEVKRKIDSKIFELQSALLSEDAGAVDEALLRECAVWFRPQHVQDIVIERSEAEGRCGWPGCSKRLPSWRLAAPMVFDLPEGEQLGRFCDRSCMAKTRIYLSAIPATPPYSRENLIRTVCPPPAAPAAGTLTAGVSGGGSEGTGGGGKKKVYKRARRRDIPPPKIPPATEAADAAGAPGGADTPGTAAREIVSGRDTGDRQRPEEKKAGATTGVDAPKELAAAASAVVNDEVACSHVPSASASKGHGDKAGAVATGRYGGVVGGAGDGGGVEIKVDSNHGGGGDRDGLDDTSAVREALAKVSLSKEGDEGGSPPVVPPYTASATVASESSAAVTPPMPAPAPGATMERATTPAIEEEALAKTKESPKAAATTTAWENMRFCRKSGVGGPSSGTPSVVSRHASLAAAAAETAATPLRTDGAGSLADSGVAPGSGELENQDINNDIHNKNTSSNNPRASGVAKENSPPGAAAAAATAASAAAPSGSPPARRRRSVSFAEGTKEDPQPDASATRTTSSRGKAAAARQAAAAAAAGASPRGGSRAGRKGRGSGNSDRGRGRGKTAPPPPPAVLGGVVERAPAVPAPMEATVGGGGARGNAGAVEGHLPRFEADLSFRVVPRGGYPGAVGGGGEGGVEEAKGLGEGEVGGRAVLLAGDELQEEEVEEEEEEEEKGQGTGEEKVAEGDGVADNDADADENDRAIWREAFGEEMPAEVATESWIDMDAVRDKEMREEFASSMPPFALLWSALSEWVTQETRVVCRAGRAAAAAAAAAAAGKADVESPPLPTSSPGRPDGAAESGPDDASEAPRKGGDVDLGSAAARPPAPTSTTTTVGAVAAPPSEAQENGRTDAAGGGIDNGPGGENAAGGFAPADFQARRAGAVAEAIETEARSSRRAQDKNSTRRKIYEKGYKGPGTKSSGHRGGDGGGVEGPTLSGALRHSGVSAMVNMHLAQAERALRVAATASAGGGRDGGTGSRSSGGGPREVNQVHGWSNSAGPRKKWVWSDTAAKARQGARVPGGWVEEEGGEKAMAAAAAAVPLKTPPLASGPAGGGNVARPEVSTTTRDVEGPARNGSEKPPSEGRQTNSTASAAAVEDKLVGPPPTPPPGPAEPVTVGGAECRRAVAAVIETLDAGSAGGAANLSIAQWKVVTLVLLTAAGLGAGVVVGLGDGDDDDDGGGGDGEGGGVGPVTEEEAAGGAEACLRLCGPETSVSESEFRILVEALLKE